MKEVFPDADLTTSSIWSHGFTALTKRKLLDLKVTSVKGTSSIATLSTTTDSHFALLEKFC